MPNVRKPVYADEEGNFDPNKYVQSFIKEKYTRITVNINKEIAEQFKAKIKSEGKKVNTFFNDAVKQYLETE